MGEERRQTNPVSERGPDYEALLRMYGEAMLKIGDVEAQVNRLANQLERIDGRERPASDGGESSVEVVQDLVSKVESLEKLIAGPDESPPSHGLESPKQATHPGRPPESAADDELREMRLEVTSLTNQLAQAKEELSQVRGRRSNRRRRKDHPKGLWARVRGRLGLSHSHDS